MSVTNREPWFPPECLEASLPDVRLFCVPHGGAGGSAFRSWQGRVGDSTEVVPVQLPGRDIRLSEPAEPSVARLAEQLAGPVRDRAGGLPYVLFGHSMGALLVYELGLTLQNASHPPSALVVSGSVPPHVPRRTAPIHTLPDKEFLTRLGLLGGIPDELLTNEEWQDLFLPGLRTDFEAAETYRPQHSLLSGIPLIALGGRDDPAAPPADVERWRDLGTDVTVRIFDGDHFFVFSEEQVIPFLSATCLAF
ncbi:thioesterase II family protein [Streptomyces sp. NBC_00059]|uniref:thioesterase II family protein n=1 Tax=Streptomyces sp. NBC_00059 TaxID=2975635 RepID=UPI0022576E7A|nr:alpha/beta fold hydrolase [Streptomyces sp. NBC_00059]MCX5412440.1 alpha/beta fold hydrolase [Streptomyces sp. NBC_00059]